MSATDSQPSLIDATFRPRYHARPMRYCDLHMHSTASDGTDQPAALARLAKQAGLDAIALTDHDTAEGVEECADACEAEGVAFAPGIELSADPGAINVLRDDEQVGERRGTMHILGYFIDPRSDHLVKIQQRLLNARAERNPQIVANLNELGVRITYDEVIEQAGGTIVGRPHIAQVLVNKGYAKSVHEAFGRYIGEGAAAYARKDRLSPGEAIEAIHTAGGVAVLAHPVQLRLPSLEYIAKLLVRLKDIGLDGIEVRHSDHTTADISNFELLADRFDLLKTGGSDYHGTRKAIRLGEQRVSLEWFEALRDAAAATRAAVGDQRPANR